MSLYSIEEIKPEVKRLIVSTLNFKDVRPEDILDDKNFFSGENTIKIDSIDVLELVVAIQKQFDVRIDDQNLARNVVTNVNSVAEFVYLQQQKRQQLL